MPTIRATFQFALGQRVRYADARSPLDGAPGQPWRVYARVYEQRTMLGPVVWYRLTRHGVTQSAYEADLVAWEGEASSAGVP